MKTNQGDKQSRRFANILTLLGIAPTKKNIFRTQLLVFIVCIFSIVFLLSSVSGGSAKQGNYEEMIRKYPELAQ
jgi:hypothetical protein